MRRIERVLRQNRWANLSLLVVRNVRRVVVDTAHDARFRWQEAREQRGVEFLPKRLNEIELRLGEDLIDAQKHTASAIADEKRLLKQRDHEAATVLAWEERAKQAFEHGHEELAAEAIAHQREHQDLSDEFEREWKAQVEVVETLKQRVRLLNEVIEVTKRKTSSVLAGNVQGEALRALDRLELALVLAHEMLEELEALERE
jgi:phage shock protein A